MKRNNEIFINKWKRVNCLFLACLIALSLVPMQAFAYVKEYEIDDSPFYDVYIEEDDKEPCEVEPYIIEAEKTEPEPAYISITPFSYISGSFPGANGAPWRLYDTGTLIVESGTVQLTAGSNNPLTAHSNAIVNIVFEGPITVGTPSLHRAFAELPNLITITGLTYFDTSNVTNMANMFRDTSSLVSLDLSGWDTSSVTLMQNMFLDANSLESLDVSGWDTSKVENMSYMFSGANSLATIAGISDWDTSSVTTMRRMFRHAESLIDLDLSGWHTSNVTTTYDMFRGASGLISLNLSGWDTHSITTMRGMFLDAYRLETLDISDWDTSSVVTMSFMFSETRSLTTIIGDLSEWNTSQVINMERMFRNAESLTVLDLSGWDTHNVTDMQEIFSNATSLQSLDLSGWETDNVTNMWRLFNNTSSLTSLDLSGWNTDNVANMSNMFTGMTALRQLILGADFSFQPNASLPGVSNTYPYTGHWQNIGNGTIYIPAGLHILTSAQLMAAFDGATMADTWVWQRTPFWDISLTPSHIFPDKATGYDPLLPHTATAVNTGNQVTGDLTIALSGANPESFVLNTVSLSSIGLNGNAAFTITPIPGLDPGTYTATVTVTGGNGISASFTVSFTVTEAPANNPIDLDDPPSYQPTPDISQPIGPSRAARFGGRPAYNILNNPLVERPDPIITSEIAPPHTTLFRCWFIYGYPDGMVRPDNPITRAEMLQIFYHLSARPDSHANNKTTRFSDLESSSWYFNALTYFEQAGLLTGFPDGTVRPNQPITNGEFVSFAIRFFDIENLLTDSMMVSQEAHWAAMYINLGLSQDWLNYFEIDVDFNPDAPITRVQAIALLNFYQGRTPDPIAIHEYLNGRTVFPDIQPGHWMFYEIMEAAIARYYRYDENGHEQWISSPNLSRFFVH